MSGWMGFFCWGYGDDSWRVFWFEVGNLVWWGDDEFPLLHLSLPSLFPSLPSPSSSSSLSLPSPKNLIRTTRKKIKSVQVCEGGAEGRGKGGEEEMRGRIFQRKMCFDGLKIRFHVLASLFFFPSEREKRKGRKFGF